MATAMYSGPRIRTNMPAEQAYNALTTAGKKISDSQLRLSTGKRINSAADDVAGFITSKSLIARNGSLKAAKQAAGDAKNVTGIAMDSLEQISNLVTTIKDMAAQASAGALGTDEKVTLANSAFRLAEQIQFITDSTVFGGKQLLQGTYSGNWVTGYSATNMLMTIGVDLDFDNKLTVAAGDEGTSQPNERGYDSQLSLYNIKSNTTFHLNATLNQLGKGSTADTPGGNTPAGASPGENTLYDNGSTLYDDTGNTSANNFAGVTGLNLSELAGVTADNLATSLFGLDGTDKNVSLTLMSLEKALTNVNKVGTYLGGIQTRLNSQEETLTSQMTNYKAAISRIEDADVADEQMKLITNQFLQSASLTSLAQANQNPTEFLQLLR